MQCADARTSEDSPIQWAATDEGYRDFVINARLVGSGTRRKIPVEPRTVEGHMGGSLRTVGRDFSPSNNAPVHSLGRSSSPVQVPPADLITQKRLSNDHNCLVISS